MTLNLETVPDTVAGWKDLVEGFLSDKCCAFHRNIEISSRYAWMHGLHPVAFKWTAMAAIASHHVRLALFPLRLDTDRTGYVDISRSMARRNVLLTVDVNTIRETNNAIFDDIFWAHLAYISCENGLERLRSLLRDNDHYQPLLAGFAAIDGGRRMLEDPAVSPAARRTAQDLIWAGNVELLQHEQRAVVQPRFDRLSPTFGALISLGSATSFEVRGMRQELAYFTSFYSYSLTRGASYAMRAQAWPRITRFDDRWRWLANSVVPRFRRFDADARRVDTSLRRVLDDARDLAAAPCVLPVHSRRSGSHHDHGEGHRFA